MKMQRVVTILSAAGILLLSATPGQAQFVTYQASGIITEADLGTPLPSALASAALGQTLFVDFTINTATSGAVNGGPGDNFYTNPIVSVSASIGSGFTPIGNDFSGVEVSADYLAAGNYLYQTQHSGFSQGTDGTGLTSGLSWVTQASGPQPLSIYPDASLSNAPLPAALATDYDYLNLFFSNSQGSGTLDIGSDISIQQVSGTVSAPEIDPTSAVSALTLLLGSLAVLRGRKVRGELLARR